MSMCHCTARLVSILSWRGSTTCSPYVYTPCLLNLTLFDTSKGLIYRDALPVIFKSGRLALLLYQRRDCGSGSTYFGRIRLWTQHQQPIQFFVQLRSGFLDELFYICIRGEVVDPDPYILVGSSSGYELNIHIQSQLVFFIGLPYFLLYSSIYMIRICLICRLRNLARKLVYYINLDSGKALDYNIKCYHHILLKASWQLANASVYRSI